MSKDLYAHFDSMCWPVPNAAAGEVEWRLRHGYASKQDIMYAASVMAAYRQMIDDPHHKRVRVIRELRARAASRR